MFSTNQQTKANRKLRIWLTIRIKCQWIRSFVVAFVPLFLFSFEFPRFSRCNYVQKMRMKYIEKSVVLLFVDNAKTMLRISKSLSENNFIFSQFGKWLPSAMRSHCFLASSLPINFSFNSFYSFCVIIAVCFNSKFIIFDSLVKWFVSLHEFNSVLALVNRMQSSYLPTIFISKPIVLLLH